MRNLRLGVIQAESSKSSKINLQRAESEVRQLASQGAQLVCLQELFLTNYFCSEESHRFFDLAEPADGPTVRHMSSLAEELGVVLVVPFFEERAPGVYHNSAAVIDADGAVLGVYRKMHIPDDPLFFEKFYFTPGDAPGYKVFQTKFAKVAVLICWDQWFPEAARIVSLMGAEVICYPTAIAWHPSEKEEFGESQVSAWQTVQRSHAITNGVFVAAANRVGFEETKGTEGLEFFGSSFVCDPSGVVLKELPKDRGASEVVDCDLGKIAEARQHWPFLRDRRIESYGEIKSRLLDKSSY